MNLNFINGFGCTNEFNYTEQYQRQFPVFAAEEVQAQLRHEPAAKAVFILSETEIASGKGGNVK